MRFIIYVYIYDVKIYKSDTRIVNTNFKNVNLKMKV